MTTTEQKSDWHAEQNKRPYMLHDGTTATYSQIMRACLDGSARAINRIDIEPDGKGGRARVVTTIGLMIGGKDFDQRAENPGAGALFTTAERVQRRALSLAADRARANGLRA